MDLSAFAVQQHRHFCTTITSRMITNCLWNPSPAAAAHRRRLLDLSRLLAGHPYWQTTAGTPAARKALKELARTKAQP